jgi:hypothetical protein
LPTETLVWRRMGAVQVALAVVLAVAVIPVLLMLDVVEPRVAALLGDIASWGIVPFVLLVSAVAAPAALLACGLLLLRASPWALAANLALDAYLAAAGLVLAANGRPLGGAAWLLTALALAAAVLVVARRPAFVACATCGRPRLAGGSPCRSCARRDAAARRRERATARRPTGADLALARVAAGAVGGFALAFAATLLRERVLGADAPTVALLVPIALLAGATLLLWRGRSAGALLGLATALLVALVEGLAAMGDPAWVPRAVASLALLACAAVATAAAWRGLA